MLGAKLFRNHARIARFVEVVFREPDGKRLDRLELARAIRATMVEESVPPLRNAPSGTSESADLRRFQQPLLQLFQTLFFAFRKMRVVSRQVPVLRIVISPRSNSSKCPAAASECR